MVRLVFRPYTQVRRTICTSAPLRASTRVSSGFTLLRHSSPSFGSRQVCSHSNPSQKLMVGRWCGPRGPPTRQLPCASRVSNPPTRTHVRLLGPCFKTGRMGSPQAVAARRPEGRALRHAVTGRADDGCRGRLGPPGLGRRRGRQRSTPRADRRTSRSRSAYGRGASPAPIRFPPDNFKHSLTLFSKSFSSFPRGTCSLSVSRPYLALDGVYRPIWAAFPNNPTRRQRLVVRQGPGRTGLSPSPASLSRGLGPGPSLRTLLQTTIRAARGRPILKLGFSRFARRY